MPNKAKNKLAVFIHDMVEFLEMFMQETDVGEVVFRRKNRGGFEFVIRAINSSHLQLIATALREYSHSNRMSPCHRFEINPFGDSIVVHVSLSEISTVQA